MKQQVQVFEIGQEGKPVPRGAFEVDGHTVDKRLAEARRRLESAGNAVRSVIAGPKRITAYVEAKS